MPDLITHDPARSDAQGILTDAPPPAAAAPRPLPLWQKISGLDPRNDAALPRGERRLALRRLFKHCEAMLREAFAEHAADTEKDERTFLWDPIPTICIELGIARRKLSALTRELTGMAVHEIADRIRAEHLPARLESEILGELKERAAPGHIDSRGRSWRATLLRWLESGRRAAGFDRAQWAIAHGFANYARLRRGCMLAHGGQTPPQLELKAIDVAADYYRVADSLDDRRTELRRDELTLADRAGSAWDDPWSKARAERPEWLEKNARPAGPARVDDGIRRADAPPAADGTAAGSAAPEGGNRGHVRPTGRRGCRAARRRGEARHGREVCFGR